MKARSFTLALLAALLLATPAAAVTFTPGAPGIGDPYFPLDGNGGYDVATYDLRLAYTPGTDVLAGTATITARATQDLSRFNLDLDGLTVRAVTVDGRPAAFRRDGGELVITPRQGLARGAAFSTAVTYDGVPQPVGSPELGLSGFLATDDGAVIAGQPEVAATWFPANDHPADKAAFRFEVSVPASREVVANGELRRRSTAGGRTTYVWRAPEPMAPYLATATIGEFAVDAFRRGGLQYSNAIDPDLFRRTPPATGRQYAISQAADASYKRLARTIQVPRDGGTLRFKVARDTEPEWDFLFVEARTLGREDWTTLPDANGHTSRSTGNSCPGWLALHPFLTHYQTDAGDGTCTPRGTTGAWHAASGASDGYEDWAVDLSRYAGTAVRLSITYASDDVVQFRGAFVDDIVGPAGRGDTSFEADGDVWDGWVAQGSPGGSPTNANDWIAGRTADTPPSLGANAQASLNRQPEVIGFLEGIFGPYPFTTAGGIVDDLDGLGFALENQTRPVYSKDFFTDRRSGDSVVVHETAHQWTGDDLALRRWRDIWLNEGFATYAEWLWSEREGFEAAQDYFDFYASFPADDPFWALAIGDPGPDRLFEAPIYNRGAMTLHALRGRLGDAAFFALVRRWIALHRGGNVNTAQFVDLAERLGGQQLDAFFDSWLYSPTKPAELGSAVALRAPAAGRGPRVETRRR